VHVNLHGRNIVGWPVLKKGSEQWAVCPDSDRTAKKITVVLHEEKICSTNGASIKLTRPRLPGGKRYIQTARCRMASPYKGRKEKRYMRT